MGKYKEAHELFDTYLAGKSEPLAEWRLKEWAQGEGPEAVRGFQRALAEDSLCTLAWFNALLDAYQVAGRDRYLLVAEPIMDRAVEDFWDRVGGRFFERPPDPDAPALLVDRAKDFTDSPLPGDTVVAARVLDKLYLLTGRDQWRGLAEQTLAAFAGVAQDASTFAGTYALAAEAHLNKPPQIVIIGPRGDQRTMALAEAAWRVFRPGRMVTTYDPTTVVLDSLPEAVAGAARVFAADPTPWAYVCVGTTCAPPPRPLPRLRHSSAITAVWVHASVMSQRRRLAAAVRRK